MRRLLLIEDQEAIAIPLADRLRRERYEVEHRANGPAGYDAAISQPFDLLILDLMLPGKSGFEICRDLRARGIAVPILMLTAKTRSADKVTGLKLGADDYLTKPFDFAELLARLEALLRRAPKGSRQPDKVWEFENLRIDPRRAEVWRNGKLVALAPKELSLVRYFADHPGAVISREELMREVWGYDSSTSTRTVDVHVGWLRQKLEDDPKHPSLIVTVVGLGYKFLPETAKELAAGAAAG